MVLTYANTNVIMQLMDIQKITRELLATGMTQQKLAELVPCSQSMISAFLNGTRGAKPSFAIGAKLLELHKERCGPAHCEEDERAAVALSS
jgi:transcriptional regulator with XRE-family HTH domain